MPHALSRLLLTALLLGGLVGAAGATEGAPELLSWDYTNSTGVGPCQNVKVSADGRFAAFDCAGNRQLLLPPHERHRLGWSRHLFVRDRVLQKNWLVDYSRHQDAPRNGDLGDWDFSQDGRWVVFSSSATNVVFNDTNGQTDVFVWDRLHDTVRMVSKTYEGKPANGASSLPSFGKSSNRILSWPPVVFASNATNLVPLPTRWTGHNVFVAYQGEYGSWKTKHIVTYPDRCYPQSCYSSPGGGAGAGHLRMTDGRVCYQGDDLRVMGAESIAEGRLYCQDVQSGSYFNPGGLLNVFPGISPQGQHTMISSSSFILPVDSKWVYGDQGEALVPFSPADTSQEVATDGETVVWSSPSSLNGDGRGVFAQRIEDIRSSGDCRECRVRVSDGRDTAITPDGETIVVTWHMGFHTQPPPLPGTWGSVYIIGRPRVNEAFRLRLVDPARYSFSGPSLLDESTDSYVTDDLESIARRELRPLVKGIAADGVTRIIVYAELPGPGDLQLALYEEGWEGATDWPRPGLSDLTASAPQDITTTDVSGFEWQTLSVPSLPLADGRWAAAALVWAPASFGSESDLVQARSRRTHLFGTFTSSAGGSVLEAGTDFELVRPPVFLVHGLWSGPETWEYDFVESQEPRLFGLGSEHRAHYPNDEPYRWNVPRVAKQLAELRRAMQDEGYAVTQALGVGHSMGGQLLRRMIGAPECVLGNCASNRVRDRLDNFYTGDLYGLVSVNSPHVGSELADRLLPFAIESPLTSSLLCRKGFCPLRGAVNDLRVASAETQGMPPLSLPTAVLVGTGGSEWLTRWSPSLPIPPNHTKELLSLVLMALSRDMSQELAAAIDEILGVPHDAAVGFDSQRGGASSFSVFPYVDETATGMHTDATAEARLSDQVLNLLLGLEPGAFVDGLPGGPGYGTSALLAAESAPIEAAASFARRRMSAAGDSDDEQPPQGSGDEQPGADGPGQPSLIVVSPAAGAVFAPGESIPVMVTSTLETRALIALGDQGSLQTGALLAATFIAPEYAGPLTVDVVARDEAGQEHSAQVEIVIQPLTPVVDLIPPRRELQVIEGDRLELRFSARYGDGVVREVSAQLVSLVSEDPLVAAVEDGQVIGITPGRTLVRATLAGSAEAWLPVEVTNCPEVQPPDVFASGSTAVCPGTSVMLTSSLADAYSWSTGETTRSISVSEPEEYTVTATQIGNCQATSQPISISAAGPTAGCEEGPPPPGTVVAEDIATTVFRDSAGILGFTAGAPDGVALTYTLVAGTGPVNGTLGDVVPGDGSPSRTATAGYTPNLGFLGSDSFEFQVCGTVDSNLVCDQAVYSIEIVEPPVEEDELAIDHRLTAIAEVPLEIELLLGPSSGLFVKIAGLPQFGTLRDGGGQAITVAPSSLTGSQVSYVSDPGFVGSDSFSYEVSDGSTTGAGLVTVVVEAATCDNSPSLCDDGR